MRRLALALMLALPLSGCIDADLTLDFKDEATVETVMDLKLGRELFDLTGKSPQEVCKDGTATVGTETISCVQRSTSTVDEFIAEADRRAGAGAGPADQIRQAAKVEKLGGGKLRVTLDFAGMAAAGGPEMAQARQMAGLMRAALAGHSLVFRVKAPKIEETTGTLAPDGKSAEYVLPLGALLANPPPPAFVTTLALKSCWFGVICL
jgi:hypothetical protein